MTQEEKQLLLKDLCARFAYHPYVYGKTGYTYNEGRLTGLFSSGVHIKTRGGSLKDYFIEEIKPYLRPLSSMTEEERLELSRLTDDKFKFYLYTSKPEIICYEKYNYLEGLKVLDWLNAHHFDYRGLIERGLALEAPEGMYAFIG